MPSISTKTNTSSDAVEACDDKLLTAIALTGVAPMPKTLPAPLCYTPSAAVNEEMLKRAEELLGYPMVVKECFGSLGKGVHLARDRAELRALSERLKGVSFRSLLKRARGAICASSSSAGKSSRRWSGARNTTSAPMRNSAERGHPIRPTARLWRSANVSPRRFGSITAASTCCSGKRGCCYPMLLSEVNSNAFFGTIERVTGVDVAARYAEYLVKAVYGE